jgi:hypothetical protein
MVLEFVVDYDQWIRHVFIGMTGSHNDINILQNPLMFARITKGHAPEVNYEINVQAYNKVYYLANNIYKKWLIFVKTITKPFSENKSWFAICHERVIGRMPSGHLVCSKIILLFFGTLISHGRHIRYGRLWTIVYHTHLDKKVSALLEWLRMRRMIAMALLPKLIMCWPCLELYSPRTKEICNE